MAEMKSEESKEGLLIEFTKHPHIDLLVTGHKTYFVHLRTNMDENYDAFVC